MALILAARVWETTTTTGTGNITLAGAVTGYRTFGSVCADGDTIWYVIAGGSEWEEGLGTWGTGGILTRTRVKASSNGGALVNFSAGSKDVMATFPGSRSGMRDLIDVSAASIRNRIYY